MLDTDRPRTRQLIWLSTLAVSVLGGLLAFILLWQRTKPQPSRATSTETRQPDWLQSRTVAPPPDNAVTTPVPPPSNTEEAAQAKVGIYAFPAPGTKRIKVGIVVPEDVPLPPGYVRHYQSTDNGKLLRPILMFHPDFNPVDAQGKPLPIPADRIVPPEMAPPGVSGEQLEIPADAYADPAKERAGQ
jgi:hypothetical protein